MPTLPLIQFQIFQRLGKLVHRIVGKFPIDPQIVDARMSLDRGRFHVDGDHGNPSVGRDDHRRMAPAHQRLRRHDETGDIGNILGGAGDNRIEPFGDDALFKSRDDFLIHDDNSLSGENID